MVINGFMPGLAQTVSFKKPRENTIKKSRLKNRLFQRIQKSNPYSRHPHSKETRYDQTPTKSDSKIKTSKRRSSKKREEKIRGYFQIDQVDRRALFLTFSSLVLLRFFANAQNDILYHSTPWPPGLISMYGLGYKCGNFSSSSLVGK